MHTLSSTGWSGSLGLVVDLRTNPSISWFNPSIEERIGGLIGFTGIFIGLAFVLKPNWLSGTIIKLTCQSILETKRFLIWVPIPNWTHV